MINVFLRYAPVQVFSAISVFLLISIQTKYLLPSEYGVLAISLVLLELVRAVCTQWLNTSMIRLYPEGEVKDGEDIARSILFMTLVNVFISAIALGTLLFFFADFEWDFYLSAIILLVAKSIFQFKVDYSRLRENYKEFTLATLSQAVLSVAFTLLLLIVVKGLVAAVLGLALSYIIGLIFTRNNITPKINLVTIKKVAIYGVPLMLSGSIALLYSRADRLIMPKYLSMNDVGVYAAQANLLAGLIGLIFMVVAMPLYPSLAKVSNNHHELFEKHKTYLTILLFISLPSLVGLCMLDVQIVHIFLGNNYISNSPVLFNVLAISFFIINFRQHYIDHGLQFLLKTSYLVPISASAVLVTFTALPHMLDTYGLDGAAGTILASSLIALLISYFTAKKFGFKFIFGLDFLKIALASIMLVIFIYSISDLYQLNNMFYSFVLNVFSAAIFYLGTCLLLNVADSKARLRSFFT